MNILFFAFANSKDPSQSLPNLIQEERDIKAVLEDGIREGKYRLVEDSFTDLDEIINTIQRYQKELVWFHYSGHAERDVLILDDEEIQSKGIAHLLKQCPNLKGVVLNGCSTKWQAEALIEAGIPIVIGTSAPVADRAATLFSRVFYKMLKEENSVEEAFKMGMGGVMGLKDVDYFRGSRPPKEIKRKSPLWGLFNENEEALNLKLPFGGESLDVLKKRLKRSAILDIEKTLEELYELLDDESSALNVVMLLLSQYFDAHKREKSRLALPAETVHSYTNIRDGLIETIKDLEEEDLKK